MINGPMVYTHMDFRSEFTFEGPYSLSPRLERCVVSVLKRSLTHFGFSDKHFAVWEYCWSSLAWCGVDCISMDPCRVVTQVSVRVMR